MFRINSFEQNIRQKLKNYNSEEKIFLKKNYVYEIFIKHGIQEFEVDYLFDAKRILKIYPDVAFSDRIDAEINAGKDRRLKIIFMFDPFLQGQKHLGKVGIVTVFKL
ncbi:hypothetical protein HYX14_03650 [Candidatus Woesearchaeota archaeon]|nr:hypothetical protein [Candidatus Woesearchaeota archaeon]